MTIGKGTALTHLSVPKKPAYQQRNDLPAREDVTWENTDQFYENTWFRRIWVVQEVAVKNATIVMGSEEVSLAEVRSCSTCMFRNGYVLGQRRSAALFPLHSILRLGESGGPLHWMLVRAAPMQATDPRDKIYALLGLYSMWRERTNSRSSEFEPDYKTEVWEVYGEVVRYLIKLPISRTAGEGSLSILLRTEDPTEIGIAEVENPEVKDIFPSWVPRWDRYTLFHNGLAFTPMGHTWDPCAHSPITVRNLQISSILSLKGFKITTIAFVERGFEAGNFHRRVTATFSREFYSTAGKKLYNTT